MIHFHCCWFSRLFILNYCIIVSNIKQISEFSYLIYIFQSNYSSEWKVSWTIECIFVINIRYQENVFKSTDMWQLINTILMNNSFKFMIYVYCQWCYLCSIIENHSIGSLFHISTSTIEYSIRSICWDEFNKHSTLFGNEHRHLRSLLYRWHTGKKNVDN